MPNNTLIPYFESGDAVTATATANVVGMTLVAISGNVQADGTFSIATCGAGLKAFGAAEYDAIAGQWVGIVRKGIVPITVGATAVVAGNEVQSDANGNVIPVTSGRPIGMACSGAAAGTQAMIALYR